jgi:hypothetical protein
MLKLKTHSGFNLIDETFEGTKKGGIRSRKSKNALIYFIIIPNDNIYRGLFVLNVFN